MEKGIVFNVEKYAIHDGPGIRTTVFLKGCAMHCWWCHNPEGQNSKRELTYRENRCTRCGECIKRCRRKALSFFSDRVSLDKKKCSMCGRCAENCPSEALSIVGRKITVEETISEIEKDKPFYEESKGGVTFSGGEPLLQLSFLSALLHECNKREIHTTLDTSGYASPKAIGEIREKVDLFLYDIKLISPAKHRKYTGVSNKLILQNLKNLAKNKNNILISLPIIPSINADLENILRTGEFISSLKGVEKVSLLPYHKTGVDKYRNLGIPYNLNRVLPPSYQKIKIIKESLEKFGLSVRIGGR
jgi:pyruvate formate lyase activating enzyme